MNINTISINNSKLTEGKYYWFKVLKSIELEKNNIFFVLEDPLGYKILLPAEYYTHYNLKPKNKILCRIDKINCKGQMFIEPKHPYYREGNVYPFRHIDNKEKINFFDKKEHIIIVSDIYNKKWEVKSTPGYYKVDSDKVDCYVEKIKKGKLYLRQAGIKIPHILTPGKYYNFIIVDEKLNPDNGRRYFILEDESRNRHPLQKKYFINYRLKKGQQITCKVERLSSEGYYYLEPLHPYYKTGKTYKFPVIRIDNFVFSNDKHQYILVLEDNFGEEVTIDLGEKLKGLPENVDDIECKVKDIHRGKPVLEIT